MPREVFHFLVVVYRRIMRCHRNDFIVFLAIVNHLHIADHFCFYKAQRPDRLGAEYQYIQRVIIQPECAGNKTIVNRVME